ncbi:hypothetical protein CJD36_008750 [Flavipsychrobacter stenotrophus]|uniref:Uncharacterized protein n=1 Tax=Flavipsychrobacter stenotrophus TaxID=2077091 RepID=A0A2S7SY53_9BACT|nr:T9SS type A sorting domain-containing protein [Flavipsychrobacter stenotrophus]PQJ11873.1 hypothetical protein CJD36_008750 [Flavipsychrobacter stenotrophus]
MKKLLLLAALLFSLPAAHGQNFFKTYFDTLYRECPVYEYTQNHGALIAISSAHNYSTYPYVLYNKLVRINNEGDTLWTKTEFIHDTIIYPYVIPPAAPTYDTVYYSGIIKSIARLNNGNYILATKDINTIRGYQLRQIDSMGNTVSTKAYMDVYLQTLLQADIRVFGIPHTDSFYLIYSGDSTDYTITPYITRKKTIVYKMDGNYNIAWSKIYRTIDCSPCAYTSVPIDLLTMSLTAENGLVFIRQDDSFLTVMTDGTIIGKRYLHKLTPDGITEWDKKLQDVMATSVRTEVGNMHIFCTHDSSIVLPVYTIDSASSSGSGYLVKFDHSGNVMDSSIVTCSINFLPDAFLPRFGRELSTGNYIFSAPLFPGFSLFDNHLNYLYSVPYPFAENAWWVNGGSWPYFYGYQWMPQPNAQGGAFVIAPQGDTSIPGTVHIAAINFDSNFNCYPVFIAGDINKDNDYNCTYNSGDQRRRGSIQLHEAVTGVDYYGYCNDTAHYFANVPYGTYAVTHPTYGYVANECGGYTLPATVPSVLTGNDFYDTLIPGTRDLRISMFANAVHPAVPTNLMIDMHNNGAATVDTTLIVTLDTRAAYIGSIPAPASVSGAILTYNLHLTPDSFALINITFLPDTLLFSTDTLIFTADCPFTNNVIPGSDSVALRTPIFSSYDPNIKLVNHLLYFNREDELVYTICFQNTGNDTARSIAVLDTLDSHIDPGTFRLLNSNHNMPSLTWLAGNRILFSFKDIYLPDSNINEPASHGCFSYSVKVKPTAANGDIIHNTAYIYFDYNPAVITNTTTNIISTPWPAGVSRTHTDNTIRLYPNPTMGKATLVLADAGSYSLQISDVTGRIVSVSEYNSKVIPIDLSGHTPGIYILRITNLYTHEVSVRKLMLNY